MYKAPPEQRFVTPEMLAVLYGAEKRAADPGREAGGDL